MEDKATSMPMVVELFGHTKIAGMVSEHAFGGSTFVRVDVPETAVSGAFTRMFHPNAVYAFNPCTEEVMLSMAAKYTQLPVTPFDIRSAATKMLAADADSREDLRDEFGLHEQENDDDREEGEEKW